ncbi:MAG: HYR domain-containing protein, partial [Bacteroidetes bacterium]
GNGNTASCNATVTVEDNAPPVAICQDVTVSLDANGMASVTAAQIDNGSSDNCGTPALSLNNSAFNCSNVGANAVTLTADDGNGNTASCNATVTVEDNIPPVALCQDVTVSLDANGMASVSAAQIDNGSSDNCGTPALSLNSSSFDCSNIGPNAVTLTADDGNGNTASCNATVTVEDNTPPNLVCQNITVSLDANGMASITLAQVVSTNSDNCGTSNATLSNTNFDCSNIGANMVTVTAIDTNGNISTCMATVNIADTTPPTALCQDLTVQLDANHAASITAAQVDNGSSDNCATPTLSLDKMDFNCNDLGANAVTLTADDGNGNTGTCTATITVKDDNNPCCMAPVANCVPTLSVNLDATGMANISTTDIDAGSVADCGLQSLTINPTNFDCSNIGANTVTLTITDMLNNQASCTTSVTVNDVTPPTAQCQDATIQLSAAGTATLAATAIDNNSFDECGAVSLSVSPTAFDCSNVGLNTATLTVTDNAGNSSTCQATVSVIASAGCTPPDIVNAGGPTIADPCFCRGNGQFDEEVVITSGSNQTWEVVQTTLLDPNTLMPFAPGTSFEENPLGNGTSQYVLAGVHLDGVGYTLEAQSPFWPGIVLSISNTCHYPDPVIENLTDAETFCIGSPAKTLTGNAGAGVEGSGSFTIDGVNTDYFDPAALGIGNHLVVFTFDAGNPASLLAPADIGCSESVSVNVQILETPSNITCNDLSNVALDPNCEALILPDMVLEGDVPCDDDYLVSIKDYKNDPVANPVSGAYLDEILTVTVTHVPSGNSCWGQLKIEDKLAPTVTCTDQTVSCTQNLNLVPKAKGLDNCDLSVDVNLVDEVIKTDAQCDDPVPNDGIAGYVTVERTFIAIDNYGNESQPCTQIITVTRPEPGLVDFPDDITWQCGQYDQRPAITSATAKHPSVTDTEPADADIDVDPALSAGILNQTGSGIPGGVSGTYCLYEISHSDATLQSCGNSFKIVRTWTVLDWCTGEIITQNNQGEDNIQIIDILDEVAPVIAMMPYSVNANVPGTHPQACVSTELLKPANVTDNCNDFTVRIFTPAGEAIYVNGTDGKAGGFIPAPGLPLGDHLITYQATDACGNTSTLDVTVTVTDLTAPVAICDEITDVNLSSGGTAEVFAETFDDGSYDQCCLDHFEVARMTAGCGFDTQFAPTVTFCCSDAANSPVTVVFRAFDCHGNYNDCMVTVNVSDKGAPVLVSCPSPQTILCDLYNDDLAEALNLGDYSVLDPFGTPEYQDNCELTVEQNVQVNVDQCGEGTISRSWSAVDPSGNQASTCTQLIRVHHVSDWVVEFPADETLVCGDSVPAFKDPVISGDNCELIAVSYEDILFNVVPDACYKISRTWTIINWCVVGDDVDQEVTEVPESQLGLPFPLCDLDGDGDCDARTFRDSWDGAAFPDATLAGTNAAPDTDPDLNPWDGFIQYQQNIKVVDNVAPVFPEGCGVADICIEDNSCGATITFKEPAIQECSPEVTITVESDLGSGFGPFTDVAPGTYSVTFTATDHCGNSNSCQSSFTVSDCKKPTPYCKNGLIVELMTTTPPMIEVWATDLDAGSFDNCPGDLTLSFAADTTIQSLVFDCEDIGAQNVELWVTDAAGNQDFCQTQIFVQANMGQCPQIDDPLVSGVIKTEDDEAVKAVEVNLNTNTGMSEMHVTADDGAFSFVVPEGSDVTVSPGKDINPLNGVSTYDLVLITKHILGTEPLNSPYKIIAADANKSNSVTTFDLVQLRKLILFIDTDFANNTSWRFVPADYVFADPQNPLNENFPEVISINNVSDNAQADFVAIKIGDVNGNADPLDLTGTEPRNFPEQLFFETPDRTLAPGETVRVAFRSKNFDVSGFQFTLGFDTDALQFERIEPALAKPENFGLKHLESGAITASWNAGEHIRLAPDAEVFTLVFKALSAGQLADLIYLDDRLTPAEAYFEKGQTAGIQLLFPATETDVFNLGQNRPNPFEGTTVIGFDLPEAAPVTLTISDLAGRTVKVVTGQYDRGHHEITIHRDELEGGGVYYYRLETPSHTATRKMIHFAAK